METAVCVSNPRRIFWRNVGIIHGGLSEFDLLTHSIWTLTLSFKVEVKFDFLTYFAESNNVGKLCSFYLFIYSPRLNCGYISTPDVRIPAANPIQSHIYNPSCTVSQSHFYDTCSNLANKLAVRNSDVTTTFMYVWTLSYVCDKYFRKRK